MTPKTIGKAKAALVVRTGTQMVAVITEITSHPLTDGSPNRLKIAGPVQCEPDTLDHLERTVLECAQRVLNLLRIVRTGFEVSVANLSASATQGRPTKIIGYSADLPLLLATLSTATRIPIPQSLVATGHIADPDGHLRLVHNLPEKIEAAALQGSTHFIHPTFDADPSLETLTPKELDRIREKRFEHQDHMRIQSIHNIVDLIEAAFDPDDIAIAALENGYYQDQAPLHFGGNHLDRAANHILMDHRKRFWNALEHAYLDGNVERSRLAMEAFVTHHTRIGRYPRDFGADLHSLILSLPPLIRQKENFPSLSVAQASQISQLAGPEDHDDLKYIFEIAAGKVSRTPRETHIRGALGHEGDDADRLLHQILLEISDDNLATEVGNHYDNARNTYRPEKVTVENEEEFHHIITAYYLHLMRHLHHHVVVTDLEQAATQAIPALDQAYQNQGGIRAATQEALHPTHGGLRTILDTLTNHLKHQHVQDYRTTRLTQAINPLDHQTQLRLTEKIMQLLGDKLPAHIREQPPERYANNLQEILLVLSHNLDQISQFFRRS